MLTLIPRLNFKYSIFDAFIALRSLFKKEFNDEPLKQILSCKSLLYFNHARTALRVVLSGIGLPSNAKVGLMTFNCLTVLKSIRMSGNYPVFIETTNDFQIDLEDLDKKIKDIDVLILNHMFGIPNHIQLIKTKYPNLIIIEDCSHSFLTKINNKYSGTFGDFSIFSIGHAKFPSIADGGFLVINNQKYFESIFLEYLKLVKPSIKNEISSILKSLALNFLHNPIIYKNLTLPILKGIDNKHDLGGKYKQNESMILKSSLGLFLFKIKEYQKSLNKQKGNGQILEFTLNKKEDEFYIPQLSMLKSNYFMVPALVNNRNELIVLFRQKGIEIGMHFSNSINWAVNFGYQIGDCPNSESIANRILTFPCHYNLSTNVINKMVKILNDYIYEDSKKTLD